MDEISFGVLVIGKYNLFNGDDICFMFNMGKGLGRYFVLNVVNGVVFIESGDFEVIDLIGYGIVYCYKWSEKVCSSIMFLVFEVDNDVLFIGLNIIESIYSICVNYLYLLIKVLIVGVEYVFVKCEIEVGFEGDMNCF